VFAPRPSGRLAAAFVSEQTGNKRKQAQNARSSAKCAIGKMPDFNARANALSESRVIDWQSDGLPSI